jgi:hypothetical protein
MKYQIHYKGYGLYADGKWRGLEFNRPKNFDTKELAITVSDLLSRTTGNRLEVVEVEENSS